MSFLLTMVFSVLAARLQADDANCWSTLRWSRGAGVKTGGMPFWFLPTVSALRGSIGVTWFFEGWGKERRMFWNEASVPISTQSTDHGVVVIDTVAVPGIPATRWVYATRPVFLSMDPARLGIYIFKSHDGDSDMEQPHKQIEVHVIYVVTTNSVNLSQACKFVWQCHLCSLR